MRGQSASGNLIPCRDMDIVLKTLCFGTVWPLFLLPAADDAGDPFQGLRLPVGAALSTLTYYQDLQTSIV